MDPFKAFLTKAPGRDGFTLIEVLIAIAVLSFISLSTYKMVDTNTDTKETVLKEDRQILQGVTAIGRLDSDISQLYNPLFASSKLPPSASASAPYAEPTNSGNTSGPFDGKTKDGDLIPQFIAEDASTIVFFTSANRRKMADSKESRFAWIRYSLRPMEKNPDDPDEKIFGGHELIRQSIASDIYTQALDWTKVKGQVLMNQVKSLEFSFWDERTKKYTTSLQELNENKNLIRSLKIELVWVNTDDNEQKIEKTFRVHTPFFNTKQDDLKAGAPGASAGSFPGSAGSDPNQGAGADGADSDGDEP